MSDAGHQIRHQWGGARWGRETCRDIGPPVHNMWCQEGGTRVSNTLSHTSRLLQYGAMGTAIWGQKKKEGAAELILSVFGGGQAEKGRLHADPFYSHNSLILLAHNFISIFCDRGRAANDQSWKGSSLDWVYRRSTCCCEVVWMDWLPSKEMYDLVITVTIIKHIQRSRGREDLQEITSDNVDFWPHGKYKCELRFIKRRHVYKTSSAFNSPFCNTAKLRDNTKSKLLKDISNGAQKTSPTSFSLSNLFLVFKSK